MQKGLYRAHNAELGCECARIDLGNPEVEAFMTRETYAARGGEPDFDDLPTLEEYKATKA